MSRVVSVDVKHHVLYIYGIYRKCTSGGVYVPHNYLLVCQVRVTVGISGLCCVCVTSFECFFNSRFLLILHWHSGPHSVSDCVCNELVSLWLIVCVCVCVHACTCVLAG